MPPPSTAGHAWLIIRRLRRNSPSTVGSGRSDGARRRLVDGPPAPLHEVEREREVVAGARVEPQVGLAPHRVDRAVAGGDRPEPALERAHRRSRSASRRPPGSTPSGRQVAKLAADVADLRVGERAHQRAQRVRLPERVRVGEGEDLAARRRRPRRPGRAPCHAAAGPGPARAARPCRAASQLDRAVGRPVRGDDQLQRSGG